MPGGTSSTMLRSVVPRIRIPFLTIQYPATGPELASQETRTSRPSSRTACTLAGGVSAVVVVVGDGDVDGLGVGDVDGLGVGVEVGVAVGDGAGTTAYPGHVTLTLALFAEAAVVVTLTPVSGSTNDRPTASGASSKLAVDGVMSSRSDCLRVGLSGAMRTVTPFTAAAAEAKLSYTPYGRRYSR